ncbi:MAG: phosphatidate cytidylyltransferase [Flavobacteriales bacterium]|nr:phosphatidate cytidylyltransferase [Flavobacteriales bacterium]
MNEVLVRSATGIVYILLTVGGAIAGPFTSLLLFLPVAMLSAGELHRLYWTDRKGLPVFWSMLTAGTLYAALAVAPIMVDWRTSFVLITAFLLIVMTATWILFHEEQAPLHAIAGHMMILLYVALPFGLVPLLVARGHELFIGFMVLLWTSDTGAYVVGRLIGKHLMVPHISPKKTWEGLVGGVFFTLVAGYFLWYFWPVLTLLQWELMALLVALTGTLGDLLESAFKRAAGVKDSGTLLPGHGGLLDRFDGFLLAAPAVWLYLLSLG